VASNNVNESVRIAVGHISARRAFVVFAEPILFIVSEILLGIEADLTDDDPHLLARAFEASRNGYR
jgi:hypothetical protein